jgi:hypothetical protein
MTDKKAPVAKKAAPKPKAKPKLKTVAEQCEGSVLTLRG